MGVFPDPTLPSLGGVTSCCDEIHLVKMMAITLVPHIFQYQSRPWGGLGGRVESKSTNYEVKVKVG